MSFHLDHLIPYGAPVEHAKKSWRRPLRDAWRGSFFPPLDAVPLADNEWANCEARVTYGVRECPWGSASWWAWSVAAILVDGQWFASTRVIGAIVEPSEKAARRSAVAHAVTAAKQITWWAIIGARSGDNGDGG